MKENRIFISQFHTSSNELKYVENALFKNEMSNYGENIFGFDLKGYSKTRIYAFLAERYLSYWFNKHTKPFTWPIFFYDTNVNKIEIK